MRVFAAGSLTNEMRIEVQWRSGKRSAVNSVKANRVYEIDEAASSDLEPATRARHRREAAQKNSETHALSPGPGRNFLRALGP